MCPHDDNSPETQRADAILPKAFRVFRKNRAHYLEQAARKEAELAAVAVIVAARDFSIANHGSIVLVWPLSPAAKEWLDEHVPAGPDHQYWGSALVVEPRYLENLLHGIGEDGLSV